MAKLHEVRRREIIQTAQGLFFQRGYDNCSVADIIDAVGIAKGTFYHYFSSKEQLVTEMIDVMAESIYQEVEAIAADRDRSVLERLSEYFRHGFALKAQNPELLIAAMEVLYRPENAILRIQMIEESNKRIAPVIGALIREGNETGAFSVLDPELCGMYLIKSLSVLSEELAHFTLSELDTGEILKNTHRILDFIDWTMARILGIDASEITVVDRRIADELFTHIATKRSQDSTKKHVQGESI